MNRSSAARSAAWCALGAVLVLTACSARSRDLARMTPTGSAIDATYDAPRARVWSAVMATLSDRGLEVEFTDGQRGVIVTDFAYAEGLEDEVACTGVATAEDAWISAIRYRVSVNLVTVGPGSTVMRIYADVQAQQSADGGAGVWVDCTSTGEVERHILDQVANHMNEQREVEGQL